MSVATACPAICAAGSYSSVANSTACNPCAVGTYAATAGLSVCAACPAGTVCPDAGMSVATACPVGHNCIAGAAAPIACATGKYRAGTGATSVGDCWNAPPGYYIPDAGATAYLPCPIGTYDRLKNEGRATNYHLCCEGVALPQSLSMCV